MKIDFLTQHQDYPRPSLYREGYVLLNGTWQFLFDEANQGLSQGFANGLPSPTLPITVPFAYQSKLSTIHQPKTIAVTWYQRELDFPSGLQSYLLHFEGVDDICDVWWNGHHLGRHVGGYTRITFQIRPDMIKPHNRLVLRVEDDLGTDRPRGKQRWQKENLGCWYVETSGIWKSVWMEPVASQYIERIAFTPVIDTLSLQTRVIIANFKEPLTLAYRILYQNELIAEGQQTLFQPESSFQVSMHTPSAQFRLHYWTPDQPHLYDVEMTLIHGQQSLDQVLTYVGMRQFQTKGRTILLNHEPVYLKMILDQGYWPESGLTPPSFQALLTDVQMIKATGFNGVRKHQKIEDERFYYLCDRLGLIVWLELPSAYEFNQTMQHRFAQLVPEVIQQFWNHPSIMAYVIMNESWGVPHILTNRAQQQFVDGLYDLIKSYQTGRFVIGNDGWEHVKTDIITIHNYVSDGEGMQQRYAPLKAVVEDAVIIPQGFPRAVFAHGYHDQGQPYLLSEYGGVALSDDQGWGYGQKVQSTTALLTRLKGLTTAIKSLSTFSGYCLTQLTDVEQEVNGILSPTRQPKVSLEELKSIHD